MRLINFLFLILIFFSLSCATLSPQKEYDGILKEIRSGSLDFAFMKLNTYLREYPNSVYKPQVRFAIAEYYFQIQDYYDAINELSSYINDYPQEKSTIFAYALLYKISLQYQDEPELLEKLKAKFFSKSLFLVFSDSKIKTYSSLINNQYKIAEYVDKIEVYKNDELFFKITP